ncbi:SHORT-CHAIN DEHYDROGENASE REDUCTASE ATA1 [Salix koriyanagi]|uniref:SHORT-CHAIN DEHYDROGENASE REDUCTASE ATA1 n=1 Tax=Salix koriyanagi TaxID=2511006 RepID=A0A9Q0WR79_9ROSI|nr:SHORT-CHAIN DEHYDROGENASE REDUCTASE ATA1 [Salix koriyanagi]
MGEVAAIAAGARGWGQPLQKYSQKKMERVIVADILDELGTSPADSIGGRYIHCDVVNEADAESAVNHRPKRRVNHMHVKLCSHHGRK